VFENKLLKRIFGPERDEVTGDWRKLYNEDLHSLYFSPNIKVIKSRRIRWVGHVARMEEMRNTYILVGKPEGKRPLGRPIRRWEDIIMDLRAIGFESLDQIYLAQGKDACSCEHGNEPSGSMKRGEFLDYIAERTISF
jgi:hypothetical protein